MKNYIVGCLVSLVISAAAGEFGFKQKSVLDWGVPVDPAGDCNFELGKGTFRMTVPGSAAPHDLSPEMNSMTGPRVVQPVRPGDFAIQVMVDGEFDPGGKPVWTKLRSREPSTVSVRGNRRAADSERSAT